MKSMIDADVLLYKAGFAAQKTLYHVFAGGSDASCYIQTCDSAAARNEILEEIPDAVVETEIEAEHVSHAIHNVKHITDRIREETQCSDYVMILSGRDNYREDVASTLVYKGNRLNMPKPVHYEALKEHIRTKHPCEVAAFIEGDDLLGIRQTEDTIICSIDKDLLMIEGHHYNLDSGELVYQTPIDGKLQFAKQLLTGDRTDNIPGLRGIGDKRALNIIDNVGLEDLWDVAQAMYLEQYEDPWVIWEQAILLWILRDYEQIQKPINFRRYLSGEIGAKEN